MKDNFQHLENYRIVSGPMASKCGDRFGAFIIHFQNRAMIVIATDGENYTPKWEHVSVSHPNRCPNWPEMCFVKNLFWEEDETVIQFHPAKSNYVNMHPNCLHM